MGQPQADQTYQVACFDLVLSRLLALRCSLQDRVPPRHHVLTLDYDIKSSLFLGSKHASNVPGLEKFGSDMRDVHQQLRLVCLKLFRNLLTTHIQSERSHPFHKPQLTVEPHER